MVHAPKNKTKLGCLKCEIIDISLIKSLYSVSLLLCFKHFTTHSKPRHLALLITPVPPNPIVSFIYISECFNSHHSALPLNLKVTNSNYEDWDEELDLISSIVDLFSSTVYRECDEELDKSYIKFSKLLFIFIINITYNLIFIFLNNK